jgi:hypothetical protein
MSKPTPQTSQDPVPCYLPLSGRILGTLVTQTRLRGQFLSGKTAQRYFKGERVLPESEKKIHSELAGVLIRGNMLPSLRQLDKLGISWSEVISGVISSHCQAWDRLVASTRSSSAPMYDRTQLLTSALMLGIIDAAFRLASARTILGYGLPPEGNPYGRERTPGLIA